jgi:hypothetical protein
MGPLLPDPFAPRIALLPKSMDVTEGAVPLMDLPPKPMDVTDGGTPFP